MSYALSGAAMTVAAIASYDIITGAEILPELTGPILALVIIATSFGYGFFTRNKRMMTISDGKEHSHIENIKRDSDSD